MAERLLDDLQQNLDWAGNVASDGFRWGGAPDWDLPDDASFKRKYEDCMPSAKVTPQSKWLSIFQILLGRELSEPDADRAIVIHPQKGKKTVSITKKDSPPDMWICVAKNHSMCWLVKLTTCATDDGFVARVALPLVIASTKQLFTPYYDEVQVRQYSVRAVAVHKLTWTAGHTGELTEFFARVGTRGDVVLNLSHHAPRNPRPRANKPEEPAEPEPGHSSAQGEGGQGKNDKVDAEGSSGLRIDDDGNLHYDQNILDALAAELTALESHDELAARFGEWAGHDATETSEDRGGNESNSRLPCAHSKRARRAPLAERAGAA